jgi:hypothetical protein
MDDRGEGVQCAVAEQNWNLGEMTYTMLRGLVVIPADT